MKIIQHIPNFVDTRGVKIEEAEFSTVEELMEVPFVKRWAQNLGFNLKFYRFSLSKPKGYLMGGTTQIGELPKCMRQNLMAEFEDGTRWYVVGYIDDPKWDGLPEWKDK